MANIYIELPHTAWIEGTVTELRVETGAASFRVDGELYVFRGLPSPASQQLYLYLEDDARIVAPTELVRRSWLIGMLQEALSNNLRVRVVIDETSNIADNVTLLPKPTP